MKWLLIVAILVMAIGPTWAQPPAGGEPGVESGVQESAGSQIIAGKATKVDEEISVPVASTGASSEATASVAIQPQVVERIVHETKYVHDKPVIINRTVRVAGTTKVVRLTRIFRGRKTIARIYVGPSGAAMQAKIRQALLAAGVVNNYHLNETMQKVWDANKRQDQHIIAIEHQLVALNEYRQGKTKAQRMQWNCISTAQATANSAHSRIGLLSGNNGKMLLLVAAVFFCLACGLWAATRQN